MTFLIWVLGNRLLRIVFGFLVDGDSLPVEDDFINGFPSKSDGGESVSKVAYLFHRDGL